MTSRIRRFAPQVAAALLAGAILGCDRGAKKSDSPPVATILVGPDNVVRVETRRLESGVSFTGELVPAELVEVVARFDGDLEVVHVREGQKVRRGQSLARYKPEETKEAWAAADAAVRAAEADLAAAENAVRRAKRLVDAGAAAPAQLETAETQRAAADARLGAARASLTSAEDKTSKLDVPSPIDGFVSKLFVHSGDRTAEADKLMTIVDTRNMELSVTVPSEALGSVQPGTPIEFRIDAFPGETFTGLVDRLNPTTEPGTRQVRVYARIANPGGKLVGGLFAIGRIIRNVKPGATAAALAALRQEGSDQVVYRVRGGSVERVVVQTGLVDENAAVVEILGAVAPGDTLLAGVLPGLRAGAHVRVLGGVSGATSGGASTSVAAEAARR